jgi:hypothetical protein
MQQMVDGEYIRASLGYDGFFLEGSFRSDRSSIYQRNNRFDYFSGIWEFSFQPN